MSYMDIPGRCAYLWVYEDFIKTAPKDAVVVEVGVALGKSIAHMARLAINAGRDDITIVAVDPWAGVARNGEQQASGPPTPDGDFKLFLDTMEKQAPEEFARIKVMRHWSSEAAAQFGDRSIDLVVIDAAHDFDNVMLDLCAWYPKIKPNGVMAGDDYEPVYQGVIDAVASFFKEKHPEVRHDQGWGTWRVQL